MIRATLIGFIKAQQHTTMYFAEMRIVVSLFLVNEDEHTKQSLMSLPYIMHTMYVLMIMIKKPKTLENSAPGIFNILLVEHLFRSLV